MVTERPSGASAEPVAAQAATAYRGFLFADLRGYTDFVERLGDTAAVELLDRYRGIVRRRISAHGRQACATRSRVARGGRNG